LSVLPIKAKPFRKNVPNMAKNITTSLPQKSLLQNPKNPLRIYKPIQLYVKVLRERRLRLFKTN
jgi:hypothetical protein